MLLKEENFRNPYRAHVIIKNKKFAHQIAQTLKIDDVFDDDMTSDDLKEKIDSIEVDEDVNAIFAVGYIDHTMGISFQALSTANINGKDVIIHERKNFDALSIMRKYDIDEFEFEYLKDLNLIKEFDIEAFMEFSHVTDNYYVNDAVEYLRSLDILDNQRADNYPDDLGVIFIKEGLESEKMWVRCENIDDENLIEGTLLNTPYQDFGVNQGDTVA